LLTKPGKPWHSFKEKIFDILEMETLSEHYSWTPQQIRSMDEEDRFNYVALLKGRGSVKEAK